MYIILSVIMASNERLGLSLVTGIDNVISNPHKPIIHIFSSH